MDSEKGHIRLVALALVLVVIVAAVAVVMVPHDVSVEKVGEGTVSVEGDRNALFEGDYHIFGLVWSILGLAAENVYILFIFIPRIFQIAASPSSGYSTHSMLLMVV